MYRTLDHRVGQVLRGENEIDGGFAVPRISSAVPCLGTSFKQAAECKFAHEVDDRIRFALSGQGHIVSSPQLIVAVKIAHDHDLHHCSRVLPCLRECSSEVIAYVVQRRSIPSLYINRCYKNPSLGQPNDGRC